MFVGGRSKSTFSARSLQVVPFTVALPLCDNGTCCRCSGVTRITADRRRSFPSGRDRSSSIKSRARDYSCQTLVPARYIAETAIAQASLAPAPALAPPPPLAASLCPLTGAGGGWGGCCLQQPSEVFFFTPLLLILSRENQHGKRVGQHQDNVCGQPRHFVSGVNPATQTTHHGNVHAWQRACAPSCPTAPNQVGGGGASYLRR